MHKDVSQSAEKQSCSGPSHQERAYDYVQCPMRATDDIDPSNMVRWGSQSPDIDPSNMVVCGGPGLLAS